MNSTVCMNSIVYVNSNFTTTSEQCHKQCQQLVYSKTASNSAMNSETASNSAMNSKTASNSVVNSKTTSNSFVNSKLLVNSAMNSTASEHCPKIPLYK